MVTYNPINNRIWIKVLPPPGLTESGLVIPSMSQESTRAKVLGVSSDGDVDKFIKVGDIIVFKPHSLEEFEVDGVTHVMVAKHNIIAVEVETDAVNQ